MPEQTASPSCWIVTEGMAGTENQCIGVAEALGLDSDIKRIRLRQPWKSLSPHLGAEQGWTFSPGLKPPWPELLIANGRKSIAAARYIKRKSGGKTFTVQIQDPRIDPAEFDLVVVPRHDPPRGDNVIVTTATPNRITQENLEHAREQFPKFMNIAKPRVAVLLGGTSHTHWFTKENLENIAASLGRLDAGLMISASRRTADAELQIIKDSLKDKDAYIWDNTGDNPYFAMLAWADTILVTCDSASMLSEACTTGKPVYMLPMDGGSEKFNLLYKTLRERGAMRPFEGKLESWSYEPLNDAAVVAQEIRRKLDARR